MNLHRSITRRKLMDAVKRQMFSLDSSGFCVSCGHEQEGCECQPGANVKAKNGKLL